MCHVWGYGHDQTQILPSAAQSQDLCSDLGLPENSCGTGCLSVCLSLQGLTLLGQEKADPTTVSQGKSPEA